MKALALKESEWQKLHREFGRVCQETLGTKFSLQPVDTGTPLGKGRVRRGYAAFGEGPKCDFVLREKGGRTPVFAVSENPDEGPAFWISVFVEWVEYPAIGGRMYDLIGISLTLFWGRRGVEMRPQLIRAEWDMPAHRGNAVAQPHWHVDSRLMVEMERAKRSEAELVPIEYLDDSLEELDGVDLEALEPTTTVTLAGLHLPMAQWREREPHPACWQAEVKDGSVFVTWLRGVLQFLKHEHARMAFGAA